MPSGDIEFGWLLWGIIILFFLSFLFSGLEAAIFSFGRYRLRELCMQGNKQALRLSELFRSPGRLMGVLIILNITANIILAALWTSGSLHLAEDVGAVSRGLFVLVAELLLAALLVLFAEITPKALFTKYSEPISLSFTPFMLFLYRVVGPVGAVLEAVANIILLPFRRTAEAKQKSVTEKELIDLVTVGESEGILDKHEKDMIRSIFEFGDRQVKEVMVPRIDIVAIDRGTGLLDAMRVIVESGFSRIPVFEESIDTVVGLLLAKDLLPVIGRGEVDGMTIEALMHSNVYFIPETKPLRELFDDFQRKKIHMAIAVDEHGGTAGLITTEDMLEEIVGEIADEYDTEQPMVEREPDGSFTVEGKLGLHELEELFGLEVENLDYDTVGGLVLAKLGVIPEKGQVVRDSNLSFEVLEIEGNRITKLRVTPLVQSETGEENQ